MGKALREGGLYYNAQGTAVDAEGKAIKDAPKRAANTVTVDQPASIANVSVVDLVKALRAPVEVARQPDHK